MDWIMYFIAFILGGIVMFMTICIVYAGKQEEPVNRVHFYVARDRSGYLCLYMGKPIRRDNVFGKSIELGVAMLGCGSDFKGFGLNVADYNNLKWEDEPVEVFINMED